MDVLKQIDHYEIQLKWWREPNDTEVEDDESDSQLDSSNSTAFVGAFPHKTGGCWSKAGTTVKEAVESCLKKNKLLIIE